MSGISDKAIEAVARVILERFNPHNLSPLDFHPANVRLAARAVITAFLAQAREEGYDLRPREPSEKMQGAAWMADEGDAKKKATYATLWRAMFDAAPKETGAE